MKKSRFGEYIGGEEDEMERRGRRDRVLRMRENNEEEGKGEDGEKKDP